jgi:DNA-directed RNA polymerase subunit RPC12/RpoP
MVAAAGNPGGGLAGAGMQAGLGVALGAQMANQMPGAQAPQAAPAAGVAPPPLPGQSTAFHVDMGGQSSGPHTVEQIQAAVAAGQVTGQTLVWANGMAAWTPRGRSPRCSRCSPHRRRCRRRTHPRHRRHLHHLPPPTHRPTRLVAPAPTHRRGSDMATSVPPPLPGAGEGGTPASAGGPPPPDSGSPTDGASAEEAARDHSLRHVTESSRTYPCTACGGELEFDIRHQKLACSHCGNVQDLVEGTDGPIAETDLRAAIAGLRENAQEHRQLVQGEKEVVCQNCGGHTTFTGSLTSTRCPYCATPIQRDDVHDAPARLPVDGVLPFAIDEKAAKEASTSG